MSPEEKQKFKSVLSNIDLYVDRNDIHAYRNQMQIILETYAKNDLYQAKTIINRIEKSHPNNQELRQTNKDIIFLNFVTTIKTDKPDLTKNAKKIIGTINDLEDKMHNNLKGLTEQEKQSVKNGLSNLREEYLQTFQQYEPALFPVESAMKELESLKNIDYPELSTKLSKIGTNLENAGVDEQNRVETLNNDLENLEKWHNKQKRTEKTQVIKQVISNSLKIIKHGFIGKKASIARAENNKAYQKYKTNNKRLKDNLKSIKKIRNSVGSFTDRVKKNRNENNKSLGRG